MKKKKRSKNSCRPYFVLVARRISSMVQCSALAGIDSVESAFKSFAASSGKVQLQTDVEPC